MNKNSLIKINFPKKPKTASTNTSSKKHLPSKEVSKPKPEWNDSLNDVNKYKLTPSEIIQKKINSVSKNLEKAKLEMMQEKDKEKSVRQLNSSNSQSEKTIPILSNNHHSQIGVRKGIMMNTINEEHERKVIEVNNRFNPLNTSSSNASKIRRATSKSTSAEKKQTYRPRSNSNSNSVEKNMFAMKRRQIESSQNEIKQSFANVQKTQAKRKPKEQPNNSNNVTQAQDQNKPSINNLAIKKAFDKEAEISEISQIESNYNISKYADNNVNLNNSPTSKANKREFQNVTHHHNHSYSTYNYNQDEIRKLLMKYDNPRIQDEYEVGGERENDENEENYSTNNPIALKHQTYSKEDYLAYTREKEEEVENDFEIKKKINNIASIEDSMKRLNEIIDISSKSSMKYKYDVAQESDRKIDVISSSKYNCYGNDPDNSEIMDINLIDKAMKGRGYESNRDFRESNEQTKYDSNLLRYYEEKYLNDNKPPTRLEQTVNIVEDNSKPSFNYEQKSSQPSQISSNFSKVPFPNNTVSNPRELYQGYNSNSLPNKIIQVDSSKKVEIDKMAFVPNEAKYKASLENNYHTYKKESTKEKSQSDEFEYLKTILLQTQNDIKNLNSHFEETKPVQSKFASPNTMFQSNKYSSDEKSSNYNNQQQPNRYQVAYNNYNNLNNVSIKSTVNYNNEHTEQYDDDEEDIQPKKLPSHLLSKI